MTLTDRKPLFFGILASLLFALLVWRLGLSSIVKGIADSGWTILAAIGLNFVSQGTSTLALRWCLEREGMRVSRALLWKSRICGEAVNTVTPLGFLGGDPARILILKQQLGGIDAGAGVILDRGIQILAVIILVICAAVATLIKIALPRTVEWIVALTLLASLLAALFLLRIWEAGPLKIAAKLAHPLLPKRLVERIEWNALASTDDRIVQFSRQDRRHFWYALGWHLATRALGILEIFIIGKALTPWFDALGALILSGLSPVVALVFAVFPAAFGLLEGSYGAVFYLMGLNPALGVSLQIIRRARGLFWTAVGLLLLSRYRSVPSTVATKS